MIWGSLSNSKIESLQRLQDRAVSMIHRSRIIDNWTPKFLAVEQLITFVRAVMVYKIFNKLSPENLRNKFHLRSHYSRYNTRFCRNIQIPNNLEYAKKGFSHSALKTWNEIPLSVRGLPTLCHLNWKYIKHDPLEEQPRVIFNFVIVTFLSVVRLNHYDAPRLSWSIG